ncbi:DEAD/DEAH box helicase [Dyella sp. LX-66]|uniref:DEAD/DEAH box helicase n=1 Tax=unclassified Dyella TaxID=2634549 RepID=UPI001BE0BBD7|nr:MULTISPECIES: DEAD/DEAH box helicase [unclassified Dyella]MBT2141916.1 DEAD/DEAH box helicase [Dyella sp. LX-66]
MYELGVPEESHLSVPRGSNPQELFLLAVGTLGDIAASIGGNRNADTPLSPEAAEELSFSASFFDAFLDSRFSTEIHRDTLLLASSAYYLARRPGSSLVLARRIGEVDQEAAVDKILRWVLAGRWESYPQVSHPLFGSVLNEIARLLAFHFYEGSNVEELTGSLESLRSRSYESGSSRELLFADLLSAIVRLRLSSSAWTTLPSFTGIPTEQWARAVRRPEFPKELWPSQILLGRAGIFSGVSGIVQMPTSAGKTRSVEIILRSAFLANRTKVAVVVAPFRALCHEISASLRHAFRDDDVRVNELSDALQVDFLQQISDLLGTHIATSPCILVMTPEKLLYVLRQTPRIASALGLVVYDEGHQFDSGARGVTYELLLTEIKAALPEASQTVLISAVIQNAQAVGDWLIGNDAQVVNGTTLLTTSRAVAFASWSERLGQLMFYESNRYDRPDYFVPRAVEQQSLERRGREHERFFPEKDVANDVALYLGIRLAPQGAVAVFCGRKDTAMNMASRAVEVYGRSFSVSPPAHTANANELARLKNLLDGHFGEQSILSRAGALGIFVHHGTTPHGIRLSIEHAMQRSLINFVACTSTLAQGVNLPIRYLIVSGIYQAGEKIKVRDFQNLIGRAGRSGMHTEGLVIFSDPAVYDKRNQRRDAWRFESSTELLSPDRAESTNSSILTLLAPIKNANGEWELRLTPEQLCELLFAEEETWANSADEVVRLNPSRQFNANAILADFKQRRRLLIALESYLMANRGSEGLDEFKASAERLASSTLAYHLADEELKPGVGKLFVAVAEYVYSQEPDPERQASYAKTLLGARNAKAIETWVEINREQLVAIESSEQWLRATWGLFASQSDDKFFHTIRPDGLAFQIATLWIRGHAYSEIFALSRSMQGSKPWGPEKRRKLSDDDIVDFCESTLGFDCALVLAAVAQFLLGDQFLANEATSSIALFQKSLKYGLPDRLTVSCYESGFSDRIVAQNLCREARSDGLNGDSFSTAAATHLDSVRRVLASYPSYFESLLNN